VILVDTSVWVEHLRRGSPPLAERLVAGEVLGHPFVTGEIACGTLRHRARVLESLQALPRAEVASDEEVLRLVEVRRLHGRGLGWVDVHLLASALLTRAALWTLDLALGEAARSAGVAHRVA
jgi:predicted nucleic acid-binding protein